MDHSTWQASTSEALQEVRVLAGTLLSHWDANRRDSSHFPLENYFWLPLKIRISPYHGRYGRYSQLTSQFICFWCALKVWEWFNQHYKECWGKCSHFRDWFCGGVSWLRAAKNTPYHISHQLSVVLFWNMQPVKDFQISLTIELWLNLSERKYNYLIQFNWIVFFFG